MITLYIKTHRVTGLKYFGKTTCDDPVRYIGGGKVWRRHLLKHGYDCDTEIYLQSEDRDYIIREALRFSRAYDIVNSDLWANIREENGIDGNPKGNIVSEETRQKMSKSRLGIPKPSPSQEVREKISSAKKGKKTRPCSVETKIKISQANTGKVRSKEVIQNMSQRNKGKITFQKTWLITYPNGLHEIIVNLTKFCRENGLNRGNMISVADGKRKHNKGYTAKRMENINEE